MCVLLNDKRLSKKGIPHSNNNRASEKLGRGGVVDLEGGKIVASLGGIYYPILIKNDFARFHVGLLLKAQVRYRKVIRAGGFPSKVKIVGPDNGGEVFLRVPMNPPCVKKL